MLYIIALFIPPLGVLLAGRVFSAIFLFVVWVFLVVVVFILPGHIIAAVLAWIIIASAKGDRRHRQLMQRK